MATSGYQPSSRHPKPEKSRGLKATLGLRWHSVCFVYGCMEESNTNLLWIKILYLGPNEFLRITFEGSDQYQHSAKNISEMQQKQEVHKVAVTHLSSFLIVEIHKYKIKTEDEEKL